MTLPACPFIPVFRAYAFVARPGTLHGLFLGNPSWKQGNVYGQFRIADTSICNSSWNLDDIDGLIVVCETGQRYATCWSDCKISPEDLLLPESAPILRAASLEQPESPETNTVSTHPDPEPASDSFRSSATAPARTQTPSFSWKRLTESYPHVTPFFDEEIHNCLQLSPKDFPFLALSEFPVATTSFFSMAATPSSIFFSERWNTRTPSATFWLSPASMRSGNGCSPICSVSPTLSPPGQKLHSPDISATGTGRSTPNRKIPILYPPNLNRGIVFRKNLLKILQLLARVRREYRTNHLLRLFIVLQKIPPAPGKPLPMASISSRL